MRRQAEERIIYLLNRSRTRRAPWPTSTSSNSGPAAWKKGTLASPATARANNVLPVPGGPTSNTPLGNLPPKFENFSGFFRNSTTSFSSCLASSHPFTSSKVTCISSGSTSTWFPNCILQKKHNRITLIH